MRTNVVLREAHVAARALSEGDLSAILRAMLTITDLGMLITDLDHRALACNSKFGEFFLVDSERVPSMEVEELRNYVYPRLADPVSWRSHLDDTYAEPSQRLEDELVLERPFLVLKRTTGPVTNRAGEIVGRIWTFQDVTQVHARQRKRDAVVEISTFHDPDPARVCRYVVEQVAEVYDATAILSIWEGDFMRFREVANAPEAAQGAAGNLVKESYCRVALETLRPVVVQDALKHPEFCEILPARLGLRRCLSVPISNMSGDPVGTLCFLDSRTEDPLTGDDIEFLSVLANRLSTELERERLYEERTAQHRQTIEQQNRDLRTTEEVLGAINHAFNLIGREIDEDLLWRSQVELLHGMLGYSGVAILSPEQDEARGFATSVGQPGAVEVRVPMGTALKAMTERPEGEPVSWPLQDLPLGSVLGCGHCTAVRLPVVGNTTLLVLGSDISSPLTERHHTLHLTALVDQVSLLLGTHRLKLNLRNASDELLLAEDRLVQAEKLAVTGTLAASVAHDIRNILASLSLVCAQPALTDREKLAQVQTQVDRFAVLSHRLLSYVRPKSISREQVDLGVAIGQAAALLGPQASISGVKIVVVDLESMPTVVADSNRLEHLLVNLMLNALQAMRTTGGELAISGRFDSNCYSLTVSDNGRGIPPHMMDRIFEPFVSSRPDGFGLGLYSCRQIANEHGWSLDASSEPEKGTMFTLGIPTGG